MNIHVYVKLQFCQCIALLTTDDKINRTSAKIINLWIIDIYSEYKNVFMYLKITSHFVYLYLLHLFIHLAQPWYSAATRTFWANLIKTKWQTA